MEKICHANTRFKKPGMAILISGKTDFRAKSIAMGEDHFIMMESIHQQDLMGLMLMHLVIEIQNIKYKLMDCKQN